MRTTSSKKYEALLWIAAWLALSVAGAVWLSMSELDSLHRKFEADSRIAHRLLTQRTVQHDTILSTLAAGATADGADCPSKMRNQITVIYPQVVSVLCNTMRDAWNGALASAEAESRRQNHAAVAGPDFGQGRYWLVLAGDRKSWALQIDIRKMIPHSEWPAGPLHVELLGNRQRLLLQESPPDPHGWRFAFSKSLASESQPFALEVRRNAGWRDLPWPAIPAWTTSIALALAACAALKLQWIRRHRAEGLLRLRKVERLNTLGELAAGIAHELNQPLTAILANCQAARRMLDDVNPHSNPDGDADIGTAREAIMQAVVQAKRAAQVVARLRNAIAQPNQPGRTRAVSLNDAVSSALHLLEPEFKARQAALVQSACDRSIIVHADPVALDQILHNLLMNALQALELVPAADRLLSIGMNSGRDSATLTIADTGPGIPQAALARLFEPFFSTKASGLGLGLSLCETLAGSMGGDIAVRNRHPRGAEFILSLPHGQP